MPLSVPWAGGVATAYSSRSPSPSVPASRIGVAVPWATATDWSVASGAAFAATTVVVTSTVPRSFGVQVAVKFPKIPAFPFTTMLVGTFHEMVRRTPPTVARTVTSGMVGGGLLPPMATDPVRVATTFDPEIAHDVPEKLDAVKVTSSMATSAGIGVTILPSVIVAVIGTSPTGTGTWVVRSTVPPTATGSTLSFAVMSTELSSVPSSGIPEQLAATLVVPSAWATGGATSTPPPASTVATTASNRRGCMTTPPRAPLLRADGTSPRPLAATR
ncbi:MAG: hypothetical protein R2711_06800 [Acidimicrobiales bacterium]